MASRGWLSDFLLREIDYWRFIRGYCDVCGSYLIDPVTGREVLCCGLLATLALIVEKQMRLHKNDC